MDTFLCAQPHLICLLRNEAIQPTIIRCLPGIQMLIIAILDKHILNFDVIHYLLHFS